MLTCAVHVLSFSEMMVFIGLWLVFFGFVVLLYAIFKILRMAVLIALGEKAMDRELFTFWKKEKDYKKFIVELKKILE